MHQQHTEQPAVEYRSIPRYPGYRVGDDGSVLQKRYEVDMANFTHTGYRGHVGHTHCGSRLHGHRLPNAGRTHALNAGGYTGFVALCGEKVHRPKAYTEFGDPIPADRRTVQEGAFVAEVTCKRCLDLAREF